VFSRESDIGTLQICNAYFNKQNTAVLMRPVILETQLILKYFYIIIFRL